MQLLTRAQALPTRLRKPSFGDVTVQVTAVRRTWTWLLIIGATCFLVLAVQVQWASAQEERSSVENAVISNASGQDAAPAPAQNGQDLLRDNIVVVLDASGSMNDPMAGLSQTRMEAAKRALVQVMQTVPEETNVGLVVFSSVNLTVPWVYPLAPLNKAAFSGAAHTPEPGGGTPLGEFLKIGADRLLIQRELQRGYGTYRLLVVTDGEANDPDLVDLYLPEILRRGITVDVIGVDMPADLALATKVHSFRRANNPEDLQRGIAKVFAEIGTAGDDSIDADALSELAALPDEVAEGMLKALAASGNHPIGGSPESQHAPLDASGNVPPGSYGTAMPAGSAPQASGSFLGDIFGTCISCLCGITCFGSIIALVIANARKRARRK